MVRFLDSFEIGLCYRVNALSIVEPIRRFFSAVSILGDYYAWVAVGLFATVVSASPGLTVFLHTLTTGLIALGVYRYLKSHLVRERPFILNQDIILGTRPLDQYSFPSGHTLHAVSFSIVLIHYAPVLLVPLCLFSTLIAISRVVLGLHYPSDVLAGALIGATIGTTSIWLAERLHALPV